MDTLPKELEDIIMGFKDQMERLELQQKIDENNFKINAVRTLCCNKEYIINKSIEDEIKKTEYGFAANNGFYMDMNDYYKNCLKQSYQKNIEKVITNNLDDIRKKNIELQLEKLIKYGKEDIEEIDEELDSNFIVIGDDVNGIAIGVTGNDYQNNFGIGITERGLMGINMGVTGNGVGIDADGNLWF